MGYRKHLLVTASAIAVLSVPVQAQQAATPSQGARVAGAPGDAPDTSVVSPPAATAGGVPVTAQEPDTQAGQQEPAEIVVTGSRIARRDYVASSPIVTQTVQAIQATGKVNIEDALNELPQFVPAQGAYSGGSGGSGRATLNLRGLGDQRNLVLLDGRRLPLASAFGIVDVNIIPNNILQGVEVISGGASSVYGSDAISGVINFKTRQRVHGIEADAQYRLSDRGDAAQQDIAISAGSDFANGRGNALLTVGYTHRDELTGSDRDFYRLGTPSGNIPGGSASFGSNLPTQAAVNQVFSKYGIQNGTVANGSAFGFNDNNTIYAIRGGVNAQVPGNYGIVNGNLAQFTARDNTVIAPQDRYSSFGRVTFDVSPSFSLYAQGLYAYNRTRGAIGYPTAIPALAIPSTNPFIPADLRTLLASRTNPTAAFTLAKRFAEIPKRYYDERLYTYQALVGAKGKLTDAINFDIFASHDETINRETLTSALRLSRVNTLLAAADGGRSICSGGYNPFSIAGSASISSACLNYITTAVQNRLSVKQDVVEGTISGKLLRLPADDLRFSLTAGYRRNSLAYDADPLLLPVPGTANTDLSATPASRSTYGSTNVKEIAGELLVPILKDLRFAKSLNLSLGYRYSDYNVSGGVSTYKAEGDYTPVQGLLFRGGYEHAIRAPNIGELYSAPSGTVVLLGSAPAAGDPCDSRYRGRTSQLRDLCIAQGIPASVIDSYTITAVAVQATVTGNANLRPEVADTFTAGTVIAPRFTTPFLSHLSLSVDYYNIKIKGAISPLPGASVVSKCYNLDGSNSTYDPKNFYCSLIQRETALYALNNIDTPYLNLGGYRTSGIDTQVDWRWDLADFGLGQSAGSLTFNSVVNYQNDFRVQTLPGQAFQNFAGTIGGAQAGVGGFNPKWRALTSFTYRRSAGEIGIRWRWIDRINDTTFVTSPASFSPGVPSYNSFDLVGRYHVNDDLEFRGGVTNFTNARPLSIAGVAGQTNPGVYDVIGRNLYVGAHVKF